MSSWPVSRRLGIVLLVMLACSMLSGCVGEQPVQQRIEEGRTVFLSNCGRCHQMDGKGFEPIYPNLAGNPIVTLHDAAPAIEIVLNGSGGMPGFRDSLDPEELAQVISYIRNSWGNNASAVSSTETR
ncbi:MAG: cytochrome c [Dehalococcoidia bacterium]